MKSFEGYLKQTAGDTYLLLAGGGIKPLSDFWTTTNSLGNYLPLTGGTMALGEGLQFHSDNNYFGTNLDARIISLLDGNGTTCDGGLIIDERATSDGVEYVTELLRIRDGEFKWRGNVIWHAGNDGSGSGLDADLLDGKLASDFALVGHAHSYINSAGFNSNGSTSAPSWGTLTSANGYTGILLIGDASGGSWAVARKGTQQFHQIDGMYYLREGAYYCLDNGNTYVSSGKGVINGTTITKVDNATYSDYTTRFRSHGTSNWDANNLTYPIAENYGQSGGSSNYPGGYGSVFLILANNGSSLGGQFFWNINHNSTSSTKNLYFRAGNNLGWQNDWKRIAWASELSDIRMKRNVKRISRLLPLYEFNFIDDNRHSYGVIAQELETMGYHELVEGLDIKSVYYLPTLSLFLAKLSNIVEENNININNRINMLEKRVHNLETTPLDN